MNQEFKWPKPKWATLDHALAQATHHYRCGPAGHLGQLSSSMIDKLAAWPKGIEMERIEDRTVISDYVDEEEISMELAFEIERMEMKRVAGVSDEAVATLRLVIAVDELTRTIQQIGRQMLNRPVRESE